MNKGPQRLTEEKGQIQQFYAGKHILLTGCTGFLGIIILEKILRTCTEISKLYILIREKANMAIEDRLKKLFENEVSLKKRYEMGNVILKFNYDINALTNEIIYNNCIIALFIFQYRR